MHITTLDERDVVVQGIMTQLRDVETKESQFRTLCEKLGFCLAYTTVNTFPHCVNPVAKTIKTPVEGQQYTGITFRPKNLNTISIMRSGNSIIWGVQKFLDDTIACNNKVGFLGIERDHTNPKEQVVEYGKIPDEMSMEDSCCLVCEPMIATGGSAKQAAQLLKKAGATTIIVLSIITSEKGADTLHDSGLIDGLITCSYDLALNDNDYIIPGLGDCGDRAFGKWNQTVWAKLHHYGKLHAT